MPQSASATRRPIAESSSTGSAPAAPSGCCPLFHNPFFINAFTNPPMITPVAQQCLLGAQAAAAAAAAAAATQLPPPTPAPTNVAPTNITRHQQHHHTSYPQVPLNLNATNGQIGSNVGVNSSVPLRTAGQPTNSPHQALSQQQQPQQQHPQPQQPPPPHPQSHSQHQVPPTSHAIHRAPSMILQEQTNYNNTSLFNQNLSLHHLFASRHPANCMALAAALASAASFPQQLQQLQQQQQHQQHQQHQHQQQPAQQQHQLQQQPPQPQQQHQNQNQHSIQPSQPMPATQPHQHLQQHPQQTQPNQAPVQAPINNSQHTTTVNSTVNPVLPVSTAAINTSNQVPMPFYSLPQMEQALALLANPNNFFSHVVNLYLQNGLRPDVHNQHQNHNSQHHFHPHGSQHHHLGHDGQNNGHDVTMPLDSLAISESKPRGLSRAEIDSLTPYIQMNEKDSRTCVICLSRFELKSKIRPLPCNHIFHAKCVDKWLRANRTCPICRRDALKTYVGKIKRV